MSLSVESQRVRDTSGSKRTSEAVDLSHNHSLTPPLISGRPSHSVDIQCFERYLERLRAYPRASTDALLHEGFWASVRAILEPHTSDGTELYSRADERLSQGGPDSVAEIVRRVVGLAPLNPIHPVQLAARLELSHDQVLTELLYATQVGLVTMRWAPECLRCGSAVKIVSQLKQLPRHAFCNGCQQENEIRSLDKVMVTFTLNPEILYILANHYACTLSKASAEENVCFVPLIANDSGAGTRYSFGCASEDNLGPALPKGRYRMHCPVAMTDNYLEVERDAREEDAPWSLPYQVSEMLSPVGQMELGGVVGATKTLHAPHGRIHFDIHPDTRSFFVLWVQRAVDEDRLLHLPAEERAPYSSASEVINHSAFHLFADQIVPLTDEPFEVSEVTLVFTDLVGSTALYAELGDGEALRLVRLHFELLFSELTRRGRVVKTIGDAVMAAFTRSEDAIDAVAGALKRLGEHCVNPKTGEPLELNVGIHRGSTVVIPVNGINDYFGQTVNIAARVQSRAAASECLISGEVLQDPRTQAYLAELIEEECFEQVPAQKMSFKGVAEEIVTGGFQLRRGKR